MAVLAVQWPANALAQVLDLQIVCLGNVCEHTVHSFGLVISFLALNHILRVDTSFRQINITCRSGTISFCKIKGFKNNKNYLSPYQHE